MLVQPILPIFPILTPTVFAQEVTPTGSVESTPTEEATPTPSTETTTPATTEETTPAPTETVESTPTEEATPTPSTETTPSDTPTETPMATPTEITTPAPDGQTTTPSGTGNEPPKETGPPGQGDILDGASTEATTSPATTPAPIEVGELHATIFQNIKAESLDLDNIDPSNSATLSTDKADYAPTDTVIITGTEFTPGETYNLTVSSDNPPPSSTTTQVTADKNGTFVYAYQLDGTYRPNYKVEAKELDGDSIDIVTFTDSEITAATLPFSDSFGPVNNDQNEVANWYDSDAGSSNIRVNNGGGRPGSPTDDYVRIQGAGKICKTINATGYQSLTLKYYWLGDNDAENNEFGKIQYKTSGSCSDTSGWNNQVAHELKNQTNWSAEQTTSLPVSLNNAIFYLRFVSESNATDETFRIDDVSVAGSPFAQPDLTAVKTNNVGGATVLGQPFTWNIRVKNSGLGSTIFTHGQEILKDERPSSGVDSYANASIVAGGGATGTITCVDSGSGSLDPNITCIANGSVSFPAGGYFDISFAVTPDGIGTLTNPQGVCSVDRNNVIVEDIEGNNSCGDSVNIVNIDLPSYICHATGAVDNWVTNAPATSGQLQGHVGISHQDGNDIIPPIAGVLPLGQNWDTEGQAIWTNNCAIPPKTGSIKVNKLLDSDGNGSYETTNPVTFTWNLDDTGANTMGAAISGITTGTHSVNENTVTDFHPTGWFPGSPSSTQYSCTNLPQGTAYQTLPATVEVTKNTASEITICNALDTGSITIRKKLDRDGSGTYEETNPADVTWSLNNTGSYVMGLTNNSVPVGQHSVTENSPANFHLTGWFPTGLAGASCTNIPKDTQDTNFHSLPISVNVGSGSTSDFTLCNARDMGEITFEKIVAGGNASPLSWIFTVASVSGTFNSGDTKKLPTGTYTVTESGGDPNYSATGASGICSGLQNGTATMTVTEEGGTCTFTNTRDTGSLKVNKRTDGNGDGDYHDTGEGINGTDSNVFTWSLDGTGTHTIGSTVTEVTTGNHNVGENTDGGYHFVGWFTAGSTQYSCTNPQGTTLPVPVTVAKNATTEITLCNARDTGTVTIIKDAVPNSDIDFSFDTSSGFPVGSFELEDDGNDNNGGTEESRMFTVTSGSYWIQEDGEQGWDLTSITCTDENGMVDVDTRKATLNVEANEAITCTFVNEKLGELIIKKDATPNSDENFRFTRSFGSSFELEDDGNDNNGGTEETVTFANLTPGSYTVTENTKEGWMLSDITCSDQTVPDVLGRTVTVDLTRGEVVTCTFKNAELGKIKGVKFDDIDGDGSRDGSEEKLNGWSIFIDTNGNGTYDDNELTDTTNGQFWFLGWHDEGAYQFDNLLPGTYSICEIPKEGWTNSTPICQTTVLTAGDTDTINFGNHKPLTIRAYKIVCDNESDLPNWADNGAPNITASTAQAYVDKSEGACRLESGWDFQWGYDSKVVKYGNGNQLGAAPNPWQTLGTTNESGYAETTLTSIAPSEDLWIREVLKPNYVPFSYPPAGPKEDPYSAELYCHQDGEHYDNYDRIDNTRFGNTYYCVAFNALNTGNVTVTKYNDDNGNGIRDGDEGTLAGWDMRLTGINKTVTAQTTGVDGITTFSGMTVGTYTLFETLKEGWRQTELRCADAQLQQFADDSTDGMDEKNGNFTLSGGQNVQCVVGNQFVNPDLTITKSNDTGGADRSPGGAVTFTLTITATDSAVLGVTVKDLPAGGFTYRNGSWTAVSTIRGDLKALAVTTEPTYASPGGWSLGDMQEGEVVTLTYIADISNDEQPGLYRDLAWAQGTDLLGRQVIANDTGNPQYFVGTEVNVVKNNQSGASVNVKQTVTGEVLGASTELPATGANQIWISLAILLISIGGLSALAGWIVRKKYV